MKRGSSGSVSFADQKSREIGKTKSEPGAVATGQGVNLKHCAVNSERLVKKLSIWPVATAPGSNFVFANSIDISHPVQH
jgi:hypothetical protein